MALKTVIGVKEADGSVRTYSGEVLNKAQADLVLKNINNSRTYILHSEASSKTDNHRLVMQCVIDNVQHNFEFDVVSDVDEDITSELTEHPLVTGDTIADHMYKKPCTANVSGKFSLNGGRRIEYEGSGERLANIQDIFERINKEGILSTLMTIRGESKDSARFKVRRNMALTHIHWKQLLNAIEFQFDFNEVIMADVQEIEYEEDFTDPNLPAITDAMSLDFTDTLLDWSEIDMIVLKKLQSIEAFTEEFIQFAKDYVVGTVTGWATGLAIGTVIGLTVLKTVLIACGSIPVYGWIAAAAIAAVCAIAAGIVAMFKAISKAKERKKFKIKQWELYKDDRKNQQEVEDFAAYVGGIHQNLEMLEDVMQVYGILTDENQECMTYIDDKYYIFRFMKNNTTETPVWTLTVYDIDNNVIAEVANCNSYALGGINECTHSNCVFRTAGGGFYIYLVNKKYAEIKNNNGSDADLKEAAKDLRNYYIMVSQTDMEQFNSMLEDIVINAMTR